MISNVNVGPDIENCTHHISLSDGHTTVGLIVTNSKGNKDIRSLRGSPMQRTAMKTTTGNQTYSDMNWPWVTIAQDNFSGGRGGEDFERDTSKYFDGHRLNVGSDKVFLGPQETYMSGLHNGIRYQPGSMTWLFLQSGPQKHIAALFTPTRNLMAGRIEIWVRRRGTPTADLTIQLRQGANGAPSNILETKTISPSNVVDIISEYRNVTFNQTLTAGTNYWIDVFSNAGDDTNSWQIGVANITTNNKQSSDGTSWALCAKSLFYCIREAKTSTTTKFFRYRNARYCVRKTGTDTPKVYIAGDRGMADPNTGELNTLVDATKTWETNEFTGAVAMIIGGKGFEEPQKWRIVTGNFAGSLAVDPPWTIEHDTTTEYVVVGVDKWREISGHGLTGTVTNIRVINNQVYFCQGDDIVIRRMRWNTSTGIHEWADDGSNKAVFLCPIRTSNGLVIWRANNKDASGCISVSKASVVDWGTNLSFAAANTMKDDYGPITNMIEYVGPNEYGYEMKMLYIFREGMIFTHNGTNLDTLNLDELATLADETNGKSAIISNRYLIFSMNQRIERYYDRSLEDIGPDRGAGLPEGRRGSCVDLMAFPSRFYAAYDAESTGYSSVLISTGGEQWHELYGAPYGERIQAIAFDVIPGKSDRILVAQGDDIIWLCRPSGTLDDTKDVQSRYTHESVLVSSWMNGGFPDIWKLFYSMKLRTMGMKKDEQYIEVDYQVDNDTQWVPMESAFCVSPVEELKINNEYGENARQFRYRLRIQTTDNTKTPILKTVVEETLGLIPIKYGWSFQFRIKENDINLLKEPDEMTGLQKTQQMKYWAENLTPLLVKCQDWFADEKRCFLNPLVMLPLAEHSNDYLADGSLVEI